MTVRSHFDFSSDRTPPAPIVRRLREIDPRFELVWLAGMWVLGKKSPNRHRYEKGCSVLAQQAKHDQPDRYKVLWARLLRQGFAFVEAYEMNDPTDHIIKDVEIREYNHRVRREAAFQERLAETCGDARMEQNKAVMRGAVELGGDRIEYGRRNPVSVNLTRSI